MKITPAAYQMQLNHSLQVAGILNYFPVSPIFVNQEYP
jgi:hypothetical protein